GAPAAPNVSSSKRSSHHVVESGLAPRARNSRGMAAESPRVRKNNALPVTSSMFSESMRILRSIELRICLWNLGSRPGRVSGNAMRFLSSNRLTLVDESIIAASASENQLRSCGIRDGFPAESVLAAMNRKSSVSRSRTIAASSWSNAHSNRRTAFAGEFAAGAVPETSGATVFVAHEEPRAAVTTRTIPTRNFIPMPPGDPAPDPRRRTAHHTRRSGYRFRRLHLSDGDISCRRATPVREPPARVREPPDTHNLPARSPVRWTNAASLTAGRGRFHRGFTELPVTFVRP